MEKTITPDALLKSCKPGVFQNPNGEKLLFRLFSPTLKDGEKVPLLIYIHGMGSVGSDNKAQMLSNGSPAKILEYLRDTGEKAFVLFPQSPCPWVDTDWTKPAHRMKKDPTIPLGLLLKEIRKLAKELPVDKKKILLAGISMGGFAEWELLQRTEGKLFAGALILCGGGDSRMAKSLTKIPVWCAHGDADSAVPVIRSRTMRDAVNKAGGHVILSEYPGFDHNIWDAVFGNRAYLDWLFAQKR